MSDAAANVDVNSSCGGVVTPIVENGELVLTADPPPELILVLEVLHTGVRALLTKRRWYGCDGQTGRVTELNEGVPLPGQITLLCVERDTCWDRIGAEAKIDHSSLFAPAATQIGRS